MQILLRMQQIAKKYFPFGDTPVLAGIAGVLIVFVSMALFNAVALPWEGAADSRAHLNYVTDIVNQGEPKPGELYSAHPPFFYYSMSVIAGNYIEAGERAYATYAIRASNIAIGMVVIIALAWSGWVLGGKYRRELAVSVPATAGLITPFVIVSGDIYNEPLAILFSVLGLTVSLIILQRGVSIKLITALSFISALGMFTRATYLAVLLVTLAIVGVAVLVHHRTNYYKKALIIVGSWFAMLSAVLITSGWYYYSNYLLSGSWFRSRPKFPVPGREQQSLGDVLSNLDFYLAVPAGLFGMRNWTGVLGINRSLSLLIFTICAASVIYVLLKDQNWKKIISSNTTLLTITALAAVVLLLYAQQLQHAIGWGNINPRYFLAGLLPIGLFLGMGSVSLPKLRGQFTSLLTLLFASGVVVHSVWFITRRYSDRAADVEPWLRMVTIADQSGFSAWILFLLIAIASIGFAILCASLWKITKSPADSSSC